MNGLKDHQVAELVSDASRALRRWRVDLPVSTREIISSSVMETLRRQGTLLDHPYTCEYFKKLPLGTRFLYPRQNEPIWVIIDHAGCGTVAEWSGLPGQGKLQMICSAAESEEACETLIVRTVE